MEERGEERRGEEEGRERKRVSHDINGNKQGVWRRARTNNSATLGKSGIT